MSASHLVRVLVCAGASLTLSAALSCSAVSSVNQAPCTDIDDCRSGFGLGWSCNEESGFCEEVELNSLCTPYPEDLLTDADKYPGDTILFATLLDGVGDAQMVNSANLAVNQVNTVDGGKLDGRAFGMINCTYGDDSNTDEQIAKAREASRYAVDAFGVQAIIGPGTSSLALEVWDEVKDEVLIVSPSATSDTLTYIDGTMKGPQNPGLFWRSAPPDSGIARKMAEILVNENHDKLGFIYKNTAYGENLADLFNKSLLELAPGAELLTFSYDDSTYGEAVTDLAAQTDLDTIIFIADSNPDVVTFLGSAAGADMSSSLGSAPLMLGDAAFSQTNVLDMIVGQPAGDVATSRVRLVVPKAPSNTVFATFAENYSKEYGESPASNGYTAESYDAAWMAIFGAAWSLGNEGGIRPLGMAAGLHFISDPNAQLFEIKPGQWAGIRGALTGGAAINISGASGDLDFDSATEETTGEVELYRIVNVSGGLGYETIEL